MHNPIPYQASCDSTQSTPSIPRPQGAPSLVPVTINCFRPSLSFKWEPFSMWSFLLTFDQRRLFDKKKLELINKMVEEEDNYLWDV